MKPSLVTFILIDWIVYTCHGNICMLAEIYATLCTYLALYKLNVQIVLNVLLLSFLCQVANFLRP